MDSWDFLAPRQLAVDIKALLEALTIMADIQKTDSEFSELHLQFAQHMETIQQAKKKCEEEDTPLILTLDDMKGLFDINKLRRAFRFFLFLNGALPKEDKPLSTALERVLQQVIAEAEDEEE